MHFNLTSLNQARMLVVDDNAATRQALVDMGGELGMRTSSARDELDALEKVLQADARSEPYELLLIDCQMPSMDGIACLRAIQKCQMGQPLRAVMMVSPLDAEELRQRLQRERLPVGAVLSKPVTPSSLFDACCTALGRSTSSTNASRQSDQGPRAKQEERLRGAHVLLVEDNAVNQEVAHTLLDRSGIQVTIVEDGRQAIDILARQSFDGVLMDCQMPVMDGYTATSVLRRDSRLRDLPIIAMTANAMAGDRERALAAGMNDQIAKPIKLDEMLATLARWIRPEAAKQQSATSNAAEESFDSLQSLPGIDISTWIGSGMGDMRLYRRLLGMFVQDQHDFPAPFEAALAAGDATTLRRLAHSLRSLAATLGAHGVERTAKALEESSAQGDLTDRSHELLKALSGELVPVLHGLKELNLTGQADKTHGA